MSVVHTAHLLKHVFSDQMVRLADDIFNGLEKKLRSILKLIYNV